MKKITYTLFIAASSILFVACGNNAKPNAIVQSETTEQTYASFGEKISSENAIQASELTSKIRSGSIDKIKIESTVNDVCQKKGCWMNVNLGNDEEMRVTFKDYAFFMPKDAANKKVIFEGKAFTDTVTVDMLRHFAEDGGKTEEEIMAITEPEIQLAFEATGVLVEN